MTWNSQRKADFRDALLFVYRSPIDLEIFFADSIGLSLKKITAPTKLEGVCFEAIEAAEAQYLLDELYRKFCGANPKHPFAQQPAPPPITPQSVTPTSGDRAAPVSAVASPPDRPQPTFHPSTPGNPRVVILTALTVEFKAVRRFLPDTHEVRHQGNVYEQGRFAGKCHTWEVLLVQAGEGNDDASRETEKAIQYFKPDVVLFIGVAGGLKDVELGDVVVAPQVYGYESVKVGETVQPRIKTEQSSYALLNDARAEVRSEQPGWLQRLPEGTQPSVYIKPIAAGEKLVASTASAVYQSLRQYCSDAIAVEMEGYGFLRAAYANRIECLVVRGISDLIDNKNSNTEPTLQQDASRNAAAFALQILSRHQIENSLLDQPMQSDVPSDDWNPLREYLYTEDVATIAQLFRQTAYEQLSDLERCNYPELDNLGSLDQIFAILRRCDRRDLAVAWVKRIIDDARNTNREIPTAIATWYRNNLPEEVAESPIKKPLQTSEARLLLTFQPIDDSEAVWVSAELHQSDREPIALFESDYKAKLSDGGQCINDALGAAKTKADCDRNDIVSFEIFLSWLHLVEPVVSWTIKSGMRRRPLWREEKSVMVRLLDRLLYPEEFQTWQGRLRSRWESICNVATGIPDGCWHECEAESCDDAYLSRLENALGRATCSSFLRWGTLPQGDLRRRCLIKGGCCKCRGVENKPKVCTVRPATQVKCQRTVSDMESKTTAAGIVDASSSPIPSLIGATATTYESCA